MGTPEVFESVVKTTTKSFLQPNSIERNSQPAAESHPLVMGGLEDQSTLEDVWIKLAQSRVRLKAMKRMRREGIGLEDMECWMANQSSKKRSERVQGKEECKSIIDLMSAKIRD